MKPIRLHIQAFGPFSHFQDVNFQAFSHTALFGFYGATGSGKTSILDAICFALFGKSSGGDREAETLRSDYASPEQDSFVSLIFSVGSKRYFIHRIPKYEKRKAKGDGTTEQKHEAFLFDVTGVALEDITLNNAPGQLIAEKKTSVVLEAIIDILGYNAHQFRQVVMLPQGKFREFLTSKSKDRSEILRQLFDLSLFEGLESVLSDKSKVLRTSLQGLLDQRDGVLQASGLESIEALEDRLKLKDKCLKEALEVLAKQSVICKDVRKNFEVARQKNDFFISIEKAEKKMAGLLSERPEIENLEKRISWAKKSQQMSAIAEKSSQSLKEKNKSAAALEEVVGALEEAQKRHEMTNQAYLKSLEAQPKRDEYEIKITQMQQFLEILQVQDPLFEDLQKIKKDKLIAEKKINVLSDNLEIMEKNLKETEKVEHALLADQYKVESGVSALEVLRLQRDQYEALEGKREEIKRCEGELEKLLKSYEKEKENFESADLAFKAFEVLYFSSRAAYLAQDLEEGQPCPVCGGREHPVLAQTEVGKPQLSDDAFKKARQDWENNEKSYFSAANNVKSGEQKLQALQGDLKNLTEQVEGRPAFLGSLKASEKDYEQQLKALENYKQSVERHRLWLAHNKVDASSYEDKQVVFGSLQKSFQTLSEDLIRKEAQNLTALAVIPSDLRVRDTLKIALKQKIMARDRDVKLHEEIVRDAQLYAQKFTSTKDLEQRLRAADSERIEAHVIILESFNKALIAQGFKSRDDYNECLLEPDEIVDLEQKVIRYDQDKKVIQERLAHLRDLVKGEKRPCLEDCERIVKEAETHLEGLQNKQAELLGLVNGLKSTKKKYEEKTESFKVLDLACRRAQTLSDIANGTGDNQRKIRLVDWLLSSYFDDILAQANLRFVKMTNYQFQLRRRLEKSKGRGLSGLDIDVFDAWSGTLRPAISLSGGESFLAALALALGLSDVVQQESGGIVLETIFIDEGFGHLDEESLDHALTILSELSGHNRSVGIISHIEEVKRRIPSGFNIIASAEGSRIETRKEGS